MEFTSEQLEYLRSQRLGRLATVRPDGSPQNNPVGFWIDDEGGVVIGGRDLGRSQKFRNVRAGSRAAFVVDDVVSVDPWTVRMVEIRGPAEAISGIEAPRPGFSSELIRIRPERIIAFGLT
jgi:pyridoxamine 5'-phosphate oxidase family protein